MTVSEGDSVVLMCTATGVPPPTISWFMNGALLADGDSSETPNATMFSVTSNLMLVNVMRESAFATITCNASNGVGAHSSDSTQLIVLCKLRVHVMIYVSCDGYMYCSCWPFLVYPEDGSLW